MGIMPIDLSGVPEIYSCCSGGVEDAGDGNIRIIRCIKRNGVLIPVLSSVMPAISAMKDARSVRDVAERLVRMMAISVGATN